MRLLLDTHALLWTIEDNPRLSARAAEMLGDPDTEKLISAVSVYEICLKHRLGKLPGVATLIDRFEQVIAETRSVPLPVTLAHACEAGLLDPKHRDPFDRLLIAQARVERVAIVSNDRVFDGVDIERVW